MLNFWKFTVFVTFLLFPANLVSAEEDAPDPGQLISVYGQGEVEVTASDVIKARKSAEEKALKIAIINVVRMLVPQESFPESAVEDLLQGKVSEPSVDVSGVVFGNVFGEVDERRLEIRKFLEEFLPKGKDYVQSFKYINEGLSQGKNKKIELPVDGDNEEEDKSPESESDAGWGIPLTGDEVADSTKVVDANPDSVETGLAESENSIDVDTAGKIDSLLQSLVEEDNWDSEEESDSDKEYYYLNMEFTFFVTFIANELSASGIKVVGGTGPRVLVLIDESTISPIKVPSFLILPSITEEKLREALEAKGYSLITRDEVRKLEDDDRVMDAMSGNEMAVEWLISSLKAEYLVLGKAMSKSFPKDGKKPPYVYGEIDAKVYDGRNSQVIWSDRVVKRLDGRTGIATLQSVRMASDIFRLEMTKFLENQTGQ